MCGFNLILNPIEAEQPDILAKLIRHRGLSATYGLWPGGVIWTHTRLPIQGLSDKWSAPIQLGDRFEMLYVGEYFNFREIDPDAENDGVVFLDQFARAVELSEVEGTPLSLQLNPLLSRWTGFGHIAILDKDTLQIYIIADPIGYKPLYYIPGIYHFSSEIKPLAYRSQKEPEWNELYFGEVMKWGYSASTRTPFNGVSMMYPGTLAIFDIQSKTLETFFYHDEEKGIQSARLRSYTPTPKDFRQILIKTVQDYMVSDRRVGILCSGGLDSSIILKLALEVRDHSTPLTVYHVENDEKEYFEELVTEIPSDVDIKTIHLGKVSSSFSFVDQAMFFNDGPVDLGSMVPQLALARQIEKDGVNVVLSGDGADELFGGYRRSKLYDSQASDCLHELPFYHLPRLDKLMMAGTIELRTPFLSTPVRVQAYNLQWERRRGDKAFLKEAFPDLPLPILEREKWPLKTSLIRDATNLDQLELLRSNRVQRFKQTYFEEMELYLSMSRTSELLSPREYI